MSYEKISKYMSMILRHRPETIGITLDEHGWADVDERMYVHLSADEQTAEQVGRRHGRPVIYQVKSGEMYRKGFRFYRSVNGVWLTVMVPAEYLRKL